MIKNNSSALFYLWFQNYSYKDFILRFLNLHFSCQYSSPNEEDNVMYLTWCSSTSSANVQVTMLVLLTHVKKYFIPSPRALRYDWGRWGRSCKSFVWCWQKAIPGDNTAYLSDSCYRTVRFTERSTDEQINEPNGPDFFYWTSSLLPVILWCQQCIFIVFPCS